VTWAVPKVSPHERVVSGRGRAGKVLLVVVSGRRVLEGRVKQALLIGLPVPHQDRHHDPAQHHLRVGQLLGASSLHLVAVVLEPDLHLRGGQAQQVRHVFALRRRQVALLAEAPLQLEGLCLGEEHPALLLLVVVVVAAGGAVLLGLGVHGGVVWFGRIWGCHDAAFIRSWTNETHMMKGLVIQYDNPNVLDR